MANSYEVPYGVEASPALHAADDAYDGVKTVANAKTLRDYLRIPAGYRKALPFVAKAPILGGLAMTAARVADTPTSDYYTRFGLPLPQRVSPLREAFSDVGVRALGAASDLAPSMLGAAVPFYNAPEEGLRSRVFRDVQQRGAAR